MRTIGFSTGALAFSDFRRGIDLQRIPGVSAIELSALREHELAALITAIPSLDLAQFKFRSFHAPSALDHMTGTMLVAQLAPVVEWGLPIVVHPDIINDDEIDAWRSLGASVLLENMDGRKLVCRTAQEMSRFFELLPEARFCFDIGHARQIDPTMSVAVELLLRYRDRLAEIHISEVNWECKHRPISSAAVLAYRRVGQLIPDETAVIIESVVQPAEVADELRTALRCLQPESPLIDASSSTSAVVQPFATT
jgi:hypothetical protein